MVYAHVFTELERPLVDQHFPEALRVGEMMVLESVEYKIIRVTWLVPQPSALGAAVRCAVMVKESTSGD